MSGPLPYDGVAAGTTCSRERGRDELQRKSREAMIVDIWRLVASVLMTLFRFRPELPVTIYSGGLFVEFFFMLTGYFVLTHVARPGFFAKNGMQQYILRFYLRVLLYVVAGVLLLYLSHMPNPAVKREHGQQSSWYSFPLRCCFYNVAVLLIYCQRALVLVDNNILPASCGSSRDRCYPIVGVFVTIIPILLYGYLNHTYGTVRVNTLYNAGQRIVTCFAASMQYPCASKARWTYAGRTMA